MFLLPELSALRDIMESVLGIVVTALVSGKFVYPCEQRQDTCGGQGSANIQTPSLCGGCCVCARFWS